MSGGSRLFMAFALLGASVFAGVNASWAISWPMIQGTEKPAEKYPAMKLWGFLQPLFQFDDTEGVTPETNFQIRRARLGVRGAVNKQVNYFFLSEFGRNGITIPGGGNAALTDASVTVNVIEGARIRMGQFKLPIGNDGLQAIHFHTYINFSLIHDAMTMRPDRNFGVAKVQAFRDIGVQVFDRFKAGDGALTYAAGVFNGSGINVTDNNSNKDLVGKIQYDVKGLEVGIWGWSGKHTVDKLSFRRFGAEVEYLRDPFHFMAEYVWGKDTLKSGSNVEGKGWYVSAGYKVLPQLKLDARYDWFDPDDAKGSNRQTRVTLGAQYFFKDRTRLTLNYEFRDDDANPKLGDLFAAQFTVIF